MKKILILCTGNSCRSQMAEGYLKHLDASLEVFSAGTKPASEVNPYAVKAMNEIGLDISNGTPENVNRYLSHSFDYVITVCDEAREKCPDFQGSFTKIHKSIEDPTKVRGSEFDKMEAFRNVRDNIKEWLTDFAERYKLT